VTGAHSHPYGVWEWAGALSPAPMGLPRQCGSHNEYRLKGKTMRRIHPGIWQAIALLSAGISGLLFGIALAR
jgi:hypothetical protein